MGSVSEVGNRQRDSVTPPPIHQSLVCTRYSVDNAYSHRQCVPASVCSVAPPRSDRPDQTRTEDRQAPPSLLTIIIIIIIIHLFTSIRTGAADTKYAEPINNPVATCRTPGPHKGIPSTPRPRSGARSLQVFVWALAREAKTDRAKRKKAQKRKPPPAQETEEEDEEKDFKFDANTSADDGDASTPSGLSHIRRDAS